MTDLKPILLAEDDPNDVELTLVALGENHIANDVQVVTDGEQALDYLFYRRAFANRPRELPAVVLLDIRMPKVDGIEVLRLMKNDPELRIVPVVILTASREERDMVESQRLGVNGYIAKPVDFHELIDAVKEPGAYWALVNEPSASSHWHVAQP